MEATIADDHAAESEDALLAELQRRLRVPRSTSEPKRQLVAVALQLARQPALDPSSGGFWKTAEVAAGDSRKRVLGYRDRILSEGLLAAAQQAIAQPSAAQGRLEPTTASLSISLCGFSGSRRMRRT